MKTTIKNLLCASAALAPLAIGAPAAFAAAQPSTTSVDTVVVTAQKRSENIQVVPIAITAASGKQLTQSGVSSIQDLTTIVSGFSGPGEDSMGSPHVRGVGSEVAEPGLENSVAVYVDGLYIGANSPAMLKLNDMDISQVEVLKGPQGTLFGRNTTGGLIQINTRNPGPTPEADLEGTIGNFGAYSGAAYFNLPINPNISTNLAIQASTQLQGYGANLFNGSPVGKDDLDLAIRNKWNFRFNDSTQLQVIADYERRNGQNILAERPVVGSFPLGGFGAPSTVTGWNTYDNADERDVTDAFGLSARLSHDFGFATLSNTLAYRSTIFDQLDFDADGTAADIFSVQWHTADHQWTDELQLASNNGGRLQWTTGFFYYNAADFNHNTINFGIPGRIQSGLVTNPVVSQVNTASYAGYAQASYKIFPNTILTGGIRYTYDQHSLAGVESFVATTPPNPPTITANPSFSHQSLAYRVSLTQKLSDDAMVYASYNRGGKSGGFNPTVIVNAPFKDEQIDAYEVGTKLTFLDKRVRLNLAGFYYNYSNIQVDFFPPGGAPVIYNGPSATLYGLDADFEVRPTSALTINGNLEVLHSAYGRFDTAQRDISCNSFPSTLGCSPFPAGYAQQTFNAQGNPLAYAPDFTASVAANYVIPTSYGKWDLSGAYAYNGGFYTTPGLEVHQSAYSLLSASVQFTAPDERFYVRLWGKNLTNTQYTSDLTISALSTFIGLNPPRTFGVTIGAKFK